jgi:hypothetical protein
MSSPQSQDATAKILVSYVFNFPMLLPWSVVKNIPDQELSAAIHDPRDPGFYGAQWQAYTGPALT